MAARAAPYRKFIMDLLTSHGQVGDSVLGAVENKTVSDTGHGAEAGGDHAADSHGAVGEQGGTNSSKAPPLKNKNEFKGHQHATYVFNWRVTRHVRAIGYSLVKFRFQPADYAGVATPLLDLCVVELEGSGNNLLPFIAIMGLF